LVTSHTLEGLRLHLSLLGISTDTQSRKGLITFRLYGHSIFRFVLSIGVLLKVCVSDDMSSLLFPLVLLNAVCQPVSLLNIYDGSGQTFGSRLIMDGWQWSRFGC